MTDSICEISVARIGSGRYRLDWSAGFSRTPVTVYAGAAADAISRTQALAVETDAPLEVAAPGLRPFFLLEAADGESLVVGERALPLEGGVNFRDLGGYRAGDGRRVGWGRLFRSGHMSKLTAADQAFFTALGIRTVCDFRLAEERASENVRLDANPDIHTIGIPPGVADQFFFHRIFERTDDPQDVVDAMHQLMRSLVRECAPHYARLFQALLAAPPGAVLLNCSAGKERTGVGAALLLMALGVPRETILYDFALSRTYFPAATELPRAREKYGVKERPGRDVEALISPLLYTRESYLQCVFDTIDEDHGSDAQFLQDALGVGAAECAKLRARFTC